MLLYILAIQPCLCFYTHVTNVVPSEYDIPLVLLLLQEVQERLEQVLEERKKLHAAWQQRKIYLDQLIDYHFFLRDAKNLDSASGQQEVRL